MERGRDATTDRRKPEIEARAPAVPASGGIPGLMLGLQRSYGNHAVAQLVAQRPLLQRMPIAVVGAHDEKALVRATVGPGGTNRTAEVEVVTDRLHNIASVSNAEFGGLYSVYGSLRPEEQVPEDRLGVLFEKLRSIEAHEPSGVDPLTAEVRFGVKLSAAVGPAAPNVPADVELVGLALQYAGIVPDGPPAVDDVLTGITEWRLRIVRGEWGRSRLGQSGQLGLRRPILPTTVRERLAADPANAATVLRDVVALRSRARTFATFASIGIDQAEYYLRLREPALDLEAAHGVPHVFTLAHGAVETEWDPYPVAEIVFGITRAQGAAQTLQRTREEVTAGSKEEAARVGSANPRVWTFIDVVGPAPTPGRWIITVERSFARARDPRHALELYWGVLQGPNFRAALQHAGDLDRMADEIERGKWATASGYANALRGAIAQVRQVEAAHARFEASQPRAPAP